MRGPPPFLFFFRHFNQIKGALLFPCPELADYLPLQVRRILIRIRPFFLLIKDGPPPPPSLVMRPFLPLSSPVEGHNALFIFFSPFRIEMGFSRRRVSWRILFFVSDCQCPLFSFPPAVTAPFRAFSPPLFFFSSSSDEGRFIFSKRDEVSSPSSPPSFPGLNRRMGGSFLFFFLLLCHLDRRVVLSHSPANRPPWRACLFPLFFLLLGRVYEAETPLFQRDRSSPLRIGKSFFSHPPSLAMGKRREAVFLSLAPGPGAGSDFSQARRVKRRPFLRLFFFFFFFFFFSGKRKGCNFFFLLPFSRASKLYFPSFSGWCDDLFFFRRMCCLCLISR